MSLRLLTTNPGFARLWLALAVSIAGDWFTVIALAVLVSRASGGSGLALAGLIVMQLLPSVVVGPLAGVLADRYERRAVLVAADLARAALVLLFIPAAATGDLWPLLVLAFAHFSLATVFEPTRSAIMPSVVGPADLLAASTLTAVTWSVMTAVGGAAGGAILSAVGLQAAFVIDALTFVGSAALILTIPRPAAASAAARDAGPVRFLDAVRCARARPATLAVLLVKGINGVALIDVFIMVYATRVFVRGEDGAVSVGLLYAAFGVGAVLGPALFNRANDGRVSTMRTLIAAGSAHISAGLLAFAAAPSLALAAAAVVVRGMGGSMNWTYSTVILQKTVPDRLLGRLFAVDLGVAQSTAAAFSVVWGLAIDGIGVRPVVWTAGVVSLLPLAAWTLALRWMRRHERRELESDVA